jgi:hypothetical protein
MVHHWRSFNYVCHDTSWPVRAFANGGERTASYALGEFSGVIYHFGYARSVADTRYKVETSAHKGEWRPGWLDDVFLNFPNRLNDLHPVVHDMWNAESFDKLKLPEFMRDHPYYDLEVID